MKLSLCLKKLAVALVAVTVCAGAKATPISLTDLNSVLTFDTASPSGVKSWSVEGQNQYVQQAFTYSLGSGSAVSLDSLGYLSATTVGNNQLVALYSDVPIGLPTASPALQIQIIYNLAGGAVGSGTSGLGEQVSILNLTGQTLHFFDSSTFIDGANFDMSFVGHPSVSGSGQSVIAQWDLTSSQSVFSINNQVEGVVPVPDAASGCMVWIGLGFVGILRRFLCRGK